MRLIIFILLLTLVVWQYNDPTSAKEMIDNGVDLVGQKINDVQDSEDCSSQIVCSDNIEYTECEAIEKNITDYKFGIC